MKSQPNEQLNTSKRWAAYATAGAAGAAALVSPHDAAEALTVIEVNVVLEDANQGDGFSTIFGGYTLGGGGGTSFAISQAFNETAIPDQGILTTTGVGNFNFVGFGAGGFYYASNLAYGAAISSGPFDVGASQRADMAWGGGYSNSQWLAGGIGYLGFRFDLGGGTQYGWAEIEVNGAPDNRGFFFAYAYGDVGEEVFAGQRVPTNVPLPGALGMLALGSVGLAAWRRKRVEV